MTDGAIGAALVVIGAAGLAAFFVACLLVLVPSGAERAAHEGRRACVAHGGYVKPLRDGSACRDGSVRWAR